MYFSQFGSSIGNMVIMNAFHEEPGVESTLSSVYKICVRSKIFQFWASHREIEIPADRYVTLAAMSTSIHHKATNQLSFQVPTMFLRVGLIVTGLMLQARALSNRAYLYTSSDGQYVAPSGEAMSISPITTRLLLAQRLGLSQYHSLEDASDDAIQVLNSFGVIQEPIFLDENRERRTEKFVAIIENVDQPEGETLKGYEL